MRIWSAPLFLVIIATLLFPSIVLESNAITIPTVEKKLSGDTRMDWEILFVTTWDKCSQRNWEALMFYASIAHQYLTLYKVDHGFTNADCVSDDLMAGYIQKALSSSDLLIIIPDYRMSVIQRHTTDSLGHYASGYDVRSIVSQAETLQVEAKDTAWTLSHEIAHFALHWKGYPQAVWVDDVHKIQALYNSCKLEDITLAMCAPLWTTVQTPNGKIFPVMNPIATEEYDTSSSSNYISNLDRVTINGIKPSARNNPSSFTFDVAEEISFQIDMRNNQDKTQSGVVVVQIQNSNGKTITTNWAAMALPANGILNKQLLFWTPKSPGTYTANFFIWEGVDKPTALAPTKAIALKVNDKIQNTPKQTTPKQTTPKEEPKLYTSGIPSNSGYTFDSADSRKSNQWGKVDRVEEKLIELREIHNFRNVNPEHQEKIDTAIKKLEGFEGSLQNIKELLHVADNFVNRGEFEKSSMIYDNNIGKINDVAFRQFEDVELSVQEAMNLEGNYIVIEGEIPEWIKNNAKWWALGQITDQDFSLGIQQMIKDGIIHVSVESSTDPESISKIPFWVMNNAGWWADGLISNGDFIKSIEFLIEEGIIKIQ